MRVQDLHQFLSKFTEGNKDGSRQGNALSNAVIYVEMNGYIHKIVRIQVQTHPTCLLYTSPSPRDGLLSRMPSSA